MSTISVPLDFNMLKALEDLVKEGIASSKSDAMRRALKMYLEEQAVQAILRAEKEPSLSGDLDELAKKIR